MSDTPRTDADFARTLERELNAANQIIRQQQLLDEENLRLQERIIRLEEAGSEMQKWLLSYDEHYVHALSVINNWLKAKEDKP